MSPEVTIVPKAVELATALERRPSTPGSRDLLRAQRSNRIVSTPSPPSTRETKVSITLGEPADDINASKLCQPPISGRNGQVGKGKGEPAPTAEDATRPGAQLNSAAWLFFDAIPGAPKAGSLPGEARADQRLAWAWAHPGAPTQLFTIAPEPKKKLA